MATQPEQGEPSEVTRLLRECAAGHDAAFDELIEVVYADLRRIAHRSLRGESACHTLDTTALVHEAYLRLVPEAVTTATDIYQLGLLLHRLLSGARPRDVRGSGKENFSNGERLNTTLPTPPSRFVARDDAKAAAARGVSRRRLEQRLKSNPADWLVQFPLDGDYYVGELTGVTAFDIGIPGATVPATSLGTRVEDRRRRPQRRLSVGRLRAGAVGLHLDHRCRLRSRRQAVRRRVRRERLVGGCGARLTRRRHDHCLRCERRPV